MSKYTICLLLSLISLATSNIYPLWQDVDGDGHPEIRCTYWAWQKVFEVCGVSLPNFGDGGSWYDNARANGYEVGSQPKINSVAVYVGNGYGHVAFVTSYDGSNICVEEGGRIDIAKQGGNGVGTQCHPGYVGYSAYGLSTKGYIYINGCSS